MTARTSEPKRMQCMEVWGGNHAVDTGVIMAGLDAWLYSRPRDEGSGGGDIHYVSSCAAGMITRLLVADVCGHGAGVSGVAEHLRKLMRRYINYHDQTQFIQEIDREFTKLKHSPGAFATAVAITFESVGNRFRMSNAGHPPPLRWSSRTCKWEVLGGARAGASSATNVPLGIDFEGGYDQVETRLQVGDLVLCYTDWFTESRKPGGDLLGIDGLLQVLQGIDLADPARVIPTLVETIERMHARNLDNDDATVLLFRPNGLIPRLPLSSYLLIPFHLLRARIADMLQR